MAALFSGYFFIWPFFTTQLKPFLGLTVACFVGFAIGRADDTMHLSPKFKLFGQFLAIFVLVIHGVVITAFGNWWLNIMLTFFWGVGIMNAINLFDNMDGVATIASIGSIFGHAGRFNKQPFSGCFYFLDAFAINSLFRQPIRLFVLQFLSGKSIYGRCRQSVFRCIFSRICHFNPMAPLWCA
ncbi:MAG: hypothetical protein IPH02_10890 [Sphingobacteriales bacterium]|nr:hypothetical protein [Sphingobacteriales bacterium]